MRWIREHTRLAAILSVALVLIIVCMVSFAHFGNSSPLGRQLQSILTKVQEPISKAGNAVANGVTGIFQFQSITKENKELKEQVAELNRELTKLKLSEAELQKIAELSNALNYQSVTENTTLVTADVIAMDDSNWFNYFTINAGTDRGVTKDSAVISGDYLVGRVIEVGPNWSKVVSIVDESNSVSFRNMQDLNQLGILSGDGKGGLTGFMLDADAKISEGNVLITSGIGVGDKGLYPEGISIGKVAKAVYDKDALLKTVTIEPFVDFKSIQMVTVIVPS